MVKLKEELNDFTDWVNEQKGCIFEVFTDERISWYSDKNLCVVKVVNDRIVSNTSAFDLMDEYMEYVPQRQPGLQPDISDYLHGSDDLNCEIQNLVGRYLADKKYDLPGGHCFVHEISVTMLMTDWSDTDNKIQEYGS